MQKKKTVVSKGKAKPAVKSAPKKSEKKLVKKADKPTDKKVAKNIAVKTEKKTELKKTTKVMTKATVEVQAEKPMIATKAQKIKENKEALKQVSAKASSKVEADNYVSTVDTKKLTADQLENYKKWLKLQRQHGEDAAPEYQMTLDFEIKSTLKHKVHGWGVVLQRRDNYIDVLFELGMKTLVCNYKV